jgi:16S rRNA (cytidine1402-2'-O)-methyltransferase
LDVLSTVDLLLCEDTRVTRKLLTHYGIGTPVASFHAHTTVAERAKWVERLSTQDLALVSDAGMPTLSDPGAELVAEADRHGHEVRSVPGPSAPAAALSVSGLPAAPHVFVGFLPRRAGQRAAMLESLASLPWTLVFFEAPHRLRRTLDALFTGLGDRELSVSRELTKLYEETWRGTLSEAQTRWRDLAPRGEYTLVVSGAPQTPAEPWPDERVVTALTELQAAGMGAKEASRRVAEQAGHPARHIYRLWPHHD